MLNFWPSSSPANLFEFEVIEPVHQPTSTSASTSSGSTKSKVPGSKGRPPTSTAGHANTRGREEGSHQTAINVGRKSSGTVKASRRTSLLTNGTPAYPHPRIPDGQLYKHCSGDMEPQERMRHVAGWTLERSRNKIKESSSNNFKYREHLMTALELTLKDLNNGELQIDWQQRQKGKGKSKYISSSSSSNREEVKGKGKEPHPRNVANVKQEAILIKSVKDMQSEENAWKEAEAELEMFEAETQKLKEEDEGERDVDGLDVTYMEGDIAWEEEDRIRIKLARKALSLEHDWATGSSQGEEIIRKVPCPSKDIDESLGSELDPRWRVVEFKADLLRSKAHSFAQLSALSQRYINAVSAGGAKAIQDMTFGATAESHQHQGNSSSNQSQVNLERILSSIRAIEDERGEQQDGRDSDDDELRRRQERIGDTSEGDILRALAGLH